MIIVLREDAAPIVTEPKFAETYQKQKFWEEKPDKLHLQPS
jgi:hypothetical protein